MSQFFISINQKRRIIIYSIAYLLALIIGTTIIHEGAHFIAALAIGVPFDEIQIGFIKGNPGVTIPDRFSNAPLAIVHYAGGFTTAAILITMYFLIWFRRYRFQLSNFVWIYGLITLVLGGVEVGYGYVEGRFHAAYVYYANSPFAISNIIIASYGIVGCILHFFLFRLVKLNRKSSQQNISNLNNDDANQ